MIELLRTNDAVVLSFAQSLLRDAGIDYLVADQNMSIADGSLGILPRRLLVSEDRADAARRLFVDAGIGNEISQSLSRRGSMLTSDHPIRDALTEHTVDAFHRGRFFLVQPAKGGHRAGMDALVLAAATPSDFVGMAVDFGAGAGAVGFAVAARCSAAHVLLVERSPEMVSFARLSLVHAGNSHLAGRIDVLQADVSLSGKAREAAGLKDRSADFVLMNPPFNEPVDRSTPNELRREAHVGSGAIFSDWLRSAAATLKPRGKVALIARPSSLADILAALSGRFGSAEILPLHATLSRPAIRIVVRAARGARGAASIMPPLVLHRQDDRSFTAKAEAILSGEASLFGD